MQLSSLDITVIFVFLAIFASVILYKSLVTSAFKAGWVEYLLLGRQITLPVFVITIVSSWYGGVIGTVQIAYNFGVYNFLVSGCVWYISALIFALFIATKLNKSKALNLGEIIERYAGKEVGLYFSILLYFKHLPLSYVIALSLFISTVLSIDYNLALVVSIAIAIMLAVCGGLRIAIMLNFIQFLLIFIALASILYFCIELYGGMEFLGANLPETHTTYDGGNSLSKIALWFVVALSTTLLSPVFHERCLAAKSPQIARKGILISMIFWVLSDIMTTSIGLYAKCILDAGQYNDALLGLMDIVLPEGIKGFCVATLCITCVSALDSYFIAAISVPAHILRKYKRSNQVVLRGITIVLTATITIAITFMLDKNIENAWLYFDSVFISALLVPICLLILQKDFIDKNAIKYSIPITTAFMVFYELKSLKQNESSFLLGVAISAVSIAVCITIKWLRSFIKDTPDLVNKIVK